MTLYLFRAGQLQYSILHHKWACCRQWVVQWQVRALLARRKLRVSGRHPVNTYVATLYTWMP